MLNIASLVCKTVSDYMRYLCTEPTYELLEITHAKAAKIQNEPNLLLFEGVIMFVFSPPSPEHTSGPETNVCEGEGRGAVSASS